MGHVFHEIYLHFNWHTKGDRPMLAGDMEDRVHKLIRNRCRQAKGVFLHGIGGTDNHVHIALSIESSVCVSEAIRQLKGGSAHDINEATGRTSLQWQRGYGVVSFGKRNLGWVLQYIANQREHHARGNVQHRLESAGTDEKPG